MCFCSGEHGVRPEDVDFVLCTHLHSDHIGWNTKLEDGHWVPTFPNARYLMPSADEELARELDGPSYQESVSPIIAAGQAELVKGNHKLGDYVRLLVTPGHTPGHVSVQLKSNSAEAIITGDALHSTAQCWYPDWHFVYDDDPVLAVTSRRHLLEQCAETDCSVLGSHFSLPSIGKVKAKGDAFSWEDK